MKTKERWTQVWPPPKHEITDPEQMTVEAKGCQQCTLWFGWVKCRKHQYSGLAILEGTPGSLHRYILGTWNSTHDNFQVLGSFTTEHEAAEAGVHLGMSGRAINIEATPNVAISGNTLKTKS